MTVSTTRPGARAFGWRSARWLVVATLLAGACGGGTDGDTHRVPQEPPTPPPTSGSATLTVAVEPTTLPADGESTGMAVATLTDARGAPQVGVALEFSATLGDVTWVTVDPDDPSNPFPTRCVAYTGTNGSAGCTFRAGFTPAQALIVVTSADLALSGTTALGVS